MEVGKIGGSCGDRAINLRNVDMLILERGYEPILIAVAVTGVYEPILIAVAVTGVYKPSRSDMSVDFPEPDGPMIAVDDSRGITRLTSLSAAC